MHKLARAVDYTPGALYRYFPSKEAILQALIVKVIEALGERVANQATGEPLEVIRRLCRVYQRFALEQPEQFGLLAMLLADPRVVLASDDVARPAVAAMLDALRPLREAFADAVESGALAAGDPELRALTTFSALHGVLSLRKQAALAPDSIDLARMTNELLDTLLRGWGAEEAIEEGAR